MQKQSKNWPGVQYPLKGRGQVIDSKEKLGFTGMFCSKHVKH